MTDNHFYIEAKEWYEMRQAVRELTAFHFGSPDMRADQPNFKPLAYLLPDMLNQLQSIASRLQTIEGAIANNGKRIDRQEEMSRQIHEVNGRQDKEIEEIKQTVRVRTIWGVVALLVLFSLIVCGIVISFAQFGWL